MAQAVISISEKRKLAVLLRMALTYADAAGAEPNAVSRHSTKAACYSATTRGSEIR